MGTITKHRIVLTLLWDSLQRDVENKAWRMARLTKLGVDLNSGSGTDVRGDKVESEINLTGEDSSILQREMCTALAEVVNMLNSDGYLWSESHTGDNKTIGRSDITLNLMMPSNWNLAGVKPLADQIHAYLVGRALCAWFMLTAVTDKQINALNEQKQNVAMARQEIESILGRRVRTMGRGQSLNVVVGEPSNLPGDGQPGGGGGVSPTPTNFIVTYSSTALTAPPSAYSLSANGTDSNEIAVGAGDAGKYMVFGVKEGRKENCVTDSAIKLGERLDSIGTTSVAGTTYSWYCHGPVQAKTYYLQNGANYFDPVLGL